MLHTYVFAASGKRVDFDRAAFLMDQGLLYEAIQSLREGIVAIHSPIGVAIAKQNGWSWPPCMSKEDRAQFVWRDYCRRHRAKHGSEFIPDADTNWGE